MEILAGHAGLQAAGSCRTLVSSLLGAGTLAPLKSPALSYLQPGKLRIAGQLLPQVRVYQASTVRELSNPLDSASLSADKLRVNHRSSCESNQIMDYLKTDGVSIYETGK